MARASGSSSGELDVQLPSGKTKRVPWLLDAPAPNAQGMHGPGSPPLAVVLMHGAGGDASGGHLPGTAAAMASAGFPCLRFTCRGGNLQHRIAVCKAVLEQAGSMPGLGGVQAFVLAGHSMGARVACAVGEEAWQQHQQGQQGQQQQQAQQEPQRNPSSGKRGKGKPKARAGAAAPWLPPVPACMLFSYPLHPPGKPDELRDALLTSLPVPALLVRGTSDPFSQQQLWDGVLARCARWEQHSVEGGDHSLRASGAGAAALEGVHAAVQRFLADVAAGLSPRAGQAGQAAAAAAAASEQQCEEKPRERQPQHSQQQHEQPGSRAGSKRRQGASGASGGSAPQRRQKER